MACSATVTPDVYYTSDSDKGGSLKVDFSLMEWKGHAGNMWIEFTVLSAPHKLSSSEMIPVGGTNSYSTWHVDIPADNVQGQYENEFWIIAEYPDTSYKNPYNVPNSLGDKPVASFFRYDLLVAWAPFNRPPVVDSGVTGIATPEIQPEEYHVVAHDPDAGDTLTYSWTVTDLATGIPDPLYRAGSLVRLMVI